MGTAVEEKVLDIKVRYEDAIRGIAKYKTELDLLKNKEVLLKARVEEGLISREKYNTDMTESKIKTNEYKEAIRVLEKEVQNNIKAENEQLGSLIALRASLSNLTRQYDEMSEAERKSASGQDLAIHINAITDKLKGAEEGTQRFYRNVGGYEEAFSKALAPMKKKLDEMTEAYMNMSKEERLGAKGDEMRKHMQDMKDQITATTAAGGKFQNQLLDLAGAQGGVISSAAQTVGGITNINQAFTAAKAGVAGFSAQLLSLLANPIVLVLAGIATAILMVTKAMDSSREITGRVNVLLAPLKTLLGAITGVIVNLAGYILSAVEAGDKALKNLSGLAESLPVVGKYFKEINASTQESITLAKDKILLGKTEREMIVESAKSEMEVSELRTKAKDKEKYTVQQRIDMMKRAGEIEKDEFKKSLALAQLRLKVAIEIARQENDSSTETATKIAELQAGVYRATKAYADGIRTIQKQMNGLKSEQAAEEKARQDAAKNAAKEAASTAKERRDKEREAVRAAEDAMLTLVKDGIEKQRKETTLSYDRHIADLRSKLSTEKNLTANARKAINDTIKDLEQKKTQDLSALSDQELTQSIEKEQKRIELMLAAVKSGSEEEYQLKLRGMQKQMEAELANIGDTEKKKKEIRDRYAGLTANEKDTSKLTFLNEAMNSEIAIVEQGEEQKAFIRDKYRVQENTLIDEHNNNVWKKQLDAMNLEYETKIAQAYGNEQEILQLKMEQKKAELDQIQQMEGESMEAFNLRKLNLENEYVDTKKDVADKEIEIEQTKYQATADITGALSTLADAASEHSKGLAMASKVLALAEIAINTGKAIAAGVAQAQSVPFPGNIVAIATTIATVLANITTAIKTVKSAKFATGGLVTGEGSGTSDSIPAQLSNGESVMTAATTSMFGPMLSAFNTMGGGIPINITANNSQAIGEDMLARAIAKGFMMAPAPVLSVQEFTSVANRTRYVESIGDI
ncbi:MAG: hypothetical protein H6Q13_3016 [Bacteroidetes bacterium]|nr:hypothetical protein [Bacteroidota bacterium]